MQHAPRRGPRRAEIVVAVRLQATTSAARSGETVGALSFMPSLVNVIAERAVLTVDLRNPDDGPAAGG